MSQISFTAVDFETATHDKFACQVGIVVVREGVIVEKRSFLIQPPDNEYEWNTIRVHHINPEDTRHCDTFDIVWDKIKDYFHTDIIVAHNASFDRDVLYFNLGYYGLSGDGIGYFVCTYDIYGLGLEDLCYEFGIDAGNHHDALFDAECCAIFFLNYLNDVSPKRYKERREICASGGYHEQLHGDVLKKDLSNANPDNPFYNKKVVITGVFSVDRNEVADRLKRMGADINTSISKKTNFVVIGEDPGPKKMEKIEKLLLEGYEIEKIYQHELFDILEKYKS